MRYCHLPLVAVLLWAEAASGATIQNASFESFDSGLRPTGWAYVASGTPAAQGFVSADWVTEGAWALKISSPTQNSPGTNVGVAQDVDLTGVLSLEFDARISLAAGNGCYLDLLIYDGPGGAGIPTAYWSRSQTGTWLDESIDVSHLSGVHTIEFRYVWGSPIYTGPATAYVDNVRALGGTVPARRLTWGGLKKLYGR
jgi:hypothetical protein